MLKGNFFIHIAKRLLPACLILSLSIVAASAATATSPWEYFDSNVNGIEFHYRHQASATTNGSSAHATATIVTTDGTKLVGGYVGAQAILFRGGSQVRATAMIMNQPNTTGVTVSTTDEYVAGNYSAQGKCKIYYTNGYFQGGKYQTDPTPVVQLGIARKINQQLPEDMQYKINENGQFYGKAISEEITGVSLNLIESIGINGKKGYVKATDLTPDFKSLEEARKYIPADKIIPVYDSDGYTIIDTFELSTGEITQLQ